MTFDELALAVRRRWRRVLVWTLIVTATTVAFSFTITPTYAASSSLSVRWVPGAQVTADYPGTQYAVRQAQVYGMLIQRDDIVQGTIATLGLRESADDLRAQLTADNPVDSSLITVRATSPSPARAAAIANEVTRRLSAAIDAGEATNPGGARIDAPVISSAREPRAPVAPRRALFALAGLVIGLGFGLLAAASYAPVGARRRPDVDPGPADEQRMPTGPMWGLPRPRLTSSHLIWAMLLAATIPWRPDSLYDGGADPVVLAKAAISLTALGLAAVRVYGGDRIFRVPVAPAAMVTGYLAVTVIGAYGSGDYVASWVVAVRAAILLTTACLVVARVGIREATRALIHVIAVILVVGAASGLMSFSGRLGSTLPPLKPNALALLAGVVCVWLIAKIMSGRESSLEWVATIGCVVVVVLTGSRSGMVGLVVAIALMALRTTHLSVRSIALLALSIPMVAYLLVGTDLISAVVLRGGSEQVTTLSNRTIAWDAALQMQRDFWGTLFGDGLAVKKISVPGQWWTSQLLDSSWMSALVQAGLIGLILISIMTLTTTIASLVARRGEGAVWLGLAAFTLVRSILESGLFDSSTEFLVFILAMIGARNAFGTVARNHPAAGDPAQLTKRKPDMVVEYG